MLDSVSYRIVNKVSSRAIPMTSPECTDLYTINVQGQWCVPLCVFLYELYPSLGNSEISDGNAEKISCFAGSNQCYRKASRKRHKKMEYGALIKPLWTSGNKSSDLDPHWNENDL